MSEPSNDFQPTVEYRKLPAVATLLNEPAIAALIAEYGLTQVTATLRKLIEDARQAITQGAPAPAPTRWPALAAAELARAGQSTLQPVINATGVIIHTNLGRAPLSAAALAAIATVSRGYSNLEYDLEQGGRGSRYDHARALLCAITAAEDAIVVNNNAAAVYLTLSALCNGRQVLISRGQLVEIGGGFRIPDVLRQSGAQLVEVGATNRTHLGDFADAISAETAAIMRVHSSNFKQLGFVSMPELADLAELTRRRAADQPLMLIDDLGSGTLLDTAQYGLAPEPMVQESVAAGADIVTFSGDKLLGGPQAGIILGRKRLIDRIRHHPMARALRVDKLTLAALDATLRCYQRGAAQQELPVWQMISAPLAELRARVTHWQQALAAHAAPSQLVPGESAIGGGSLPGETLPTILLALDVAQPDKAAAALRRQNPALIARIHNNQLLFDARTVLPAQDETLIRALATLIGTGAQGNGESLDGVQ